MHKLIILPGATDALGGTLVTLSLLIKGLSQRNLTPHFCVLTRAGSLMESYLTAAGHRDALQLIEGECDRTFVANALKWVNQQPHQDPLLLDNCIARELLGTLIKGSLKLRLSRRPVYFFFHDLGLSYNPIGYYLRKLMFTGLSPIGLCNSDFTAGHVRKFVSDIAGALYQPVDTDKFRPLSDRTSTPPEPLKKIIQTGDRIMLTPSRLNKPGIINDKNLRGLIPVLAKLTEQGHRYRSVIIGEDSSEDGSHTRALVEAAAAAGVEHRLTILPPTFEIERYFPYADVVVTLAPREPFGRTVVEALACGTPVVGSRSGGIGEILNHFAPEWTVDPDDVTMTAKTIHTVVNSDHTAKTLADAQAWVKSRCSVETYAQSILNVVSSADKFSEQQTTQQPLSKRVVGHE